MFTKTTAAALFAASLAAAQNGTIIVSPVNGGNTNVNLNVDINFTQTFLQLGPTGLFPCPYEFQQHCPGGCPAPPPVPYGWEVATVPCSVCGPNQPYVTVTTCQYAQPTPPPPAYQPGECESCYTDVVVYTPPATCGGCPPPPCTTATHIYSPPPCTTTAPPPPPPPVTTSCPPTVTPPPPVVYSSECHSCPVGPYTMTSACPSCPQTYVPATKPATICHECAQTTAPVAPPAYTGAASKKEVGAGIAVAGLMAVAVLL